MNEDEFCKPSSKGNIKIWNETKWKPHFSITTMAFHLKKTDNNQKKKKKTKTNEEEKKSNTFDLDG